MAGAMRRMGIYLGLVEDDDPAATAGTTPGSPTTPTTTAGTAGTRDDHYDERYDDGYADDDLDADGRCPAAREPEPLPVAPRPGRPAARSRPGRRLGRRGLGRRRGSAPWAAGPSAPPPRSSPSASRSPPCVEPAPAPAPQPYRITTLHPRTYNEARTIGERFRDGMPVIMNLTEMDDADAKRLVDFAAGLSFGLRGSIERVTAKVFLLSPQNVDVTAEDKARIREGGFFNQS